MADERPPIWVQLTTEYWKTGPSSKLIIDIDDTLWHFSTENITEYNSLISTDTSLEYSR